MSTPQSRRKQLEIGRRVHTGLKIDLRLRPRIRIHSFGAIQIEWRAQHESRVNGTILDHYNLASLRVTVVPTNYRDWSSAFTPGWRSSIFICSHRLSDSLGAIQGLERATHPPTTNHGTTRSTCFFSRLQAKQIQVNLLSATNLQCYPRSNP